MQIDILQMNFALKGSFLHGLQEGRQQQSLQFFFLLMIDFSKIYCKSHPYELINNFCADKNCLVGLCPTCICEHTEMHIHSKTQPQFENIRSTYTRLHQEIQLQIDLISTDKDRLGNLQASIREKKENFKSILQRTRNDCLQLVRDHFDQLQKNWENDIVNEEKKHSLHSNYRLDTLSALISKEISELIDQSRRINSISFVEEIPRIVKESLVESKAFHNRITEEFEDNEKYTPIINYTPENLKEVEEALKKLLSLEFSIPIKKYISTNSASLVNSSSLSSANRVPNFSFKVESPKIQGPQHSLVIKRASVEKPQAQYLLTQSALCSVPIVLTTSYLNLSSQPKQKLMGSQSQVVQKSRMSRINFTPSYVDRVQGNKFTKVENKSQLKQKKSGITILGNQSQIESNTSEKENNKK